MKPRVFKIFGNYKGDFHTYEGHEAVQLAGPDIPQGEKIQVIEYSALEQAQKRIAELEDEFSSLFDDYQDLGRRCAEDGKKIEELKAALYEVRSQMKRSGLDKSKTFEGPYGLIEQALNSNNRQDSANPEVAENTIVCQGNTDET